MSEGESSDSTLSESEVDEILRRLRRAEQQLRRVDQEVCDREIQAVLAELKGIEDLVRQEHKPELKVEK